MKITDVKVFPVDEDKLKAYATITFENCFIVRDLKVISGNKGYFIAMPSKKRRYTSTSISLQRQRSRSTAAQRSSWNRRPITRGTAACD